MRQLVVIHGGETFDTYEEYLAYLKRETYDPHAEHERRWRHTLPEALGDEWDVLMPTMPSKYNAKYLEWSIWFEKIIPHLTDGVVLVGHSLGGIFLAKYLSEHKLPVRIGGTFLIAAPFDTEDTDEYTLADFALPTSLEGLAHQGGTIRLYHSEDDPVVPFADVSKYQRALPEAAVRTFTDRGHFLTPEFPELLDDIRSLAK